MNFQNQLPDFYSLYLDQRFLTTEPKDNLVDCTHCHMLKSAKPFHAGTKCCTFHPFLANFLVGGILSLPSPGTETLRELIIEKKGATPLGLVAPEHYQYKFLHKKPTDFGRRLDLLCPFYQSANGTCGIWKYRGHECLSYNCVSQFGVRGEEYWSRIREALHQFEMTLAHHLMLEKGFSQIEVERCMDLVRIPDPKQRKEAYSDLEWTNLWNHQFSNPLAFYMECYQLAVAPPPTIQSAVQGLNLRFPAPPTE